jgi:hypothetical protein
MKLLSTTDKEFIQNASSLFDRNGELLIFIRYPFQAGRRDFKIVKTQNELLTTLTGLKAQDSVTIFNSFETIFHGLIDENKIETIGAKWDAADSHDWVIIRDFDGLDWNFAQEKRDLTEQLLDRIGQDLTIVVEPNWLDDSVSTTAYVPDKKGL